MTPPALPDVSSNEWVIYASILSVLVLAITSASERVAKMFGQLGRVWFDFNERRQQAAAAKRGADYAALESALLRLEKQLRASDARVTKLVREHEREVENLRGELLAWRGWAHEIRAVAADNGWTLPEPPKH